MAQLWGGRFTGKTDALAGAFNASIRFDARLLPQDIRGSIAHVTMLAAQGILSKTEAETIADTLREIEADVASGALDIDPQAEDIHSFVEAELIARIGDAGKKLHTGRSRNDQVALDMKLYVRDEIDEMRRILLDLLAVIEEIIEDGRETYLPGFTHLQKAQPTTLAHHFGAYFEMFQRDRKRLGDLRVRMNTCPLGAGALAGTTYPLDRGLVAEQLGFDRPAANSMDAVSDRDYLIEFVSACAIAQMHGSRLAEELILWNSDEYRFIEISDAYSTGSSIMPQKKNPDIAELIRGKTGRVNGALVSLLTTMKGLPLAYNKDMQEDKEPAFDAIDTTKQSLTLLSGMLREITFRAEVMEESARRGFTNATDVADYLVTKGLPFREAHEITGKLVLTCVDRGCALDELPLSEYQKESALFEEDIFDAIRMETCVERRNTTGGPGREAMEQEIRENRRVLDRARSEDA